MSTGSRTSAHTSPQAGPPLDLSGRTLADFHVLRKLGQGGMGQVYLAEQISLKRNVALKILRPELAADAQALARFNHEAKAVARVTHANIVQVYAFGEADGIPYIALEYVEGRNLKEYVARKGPPDVLVSLSIMRQVASALQRAGESGIVHRDIKPENILLTRKGEVKVADFGLARCLEGTGAAVNLTQSGVSMGTPLYMSPEQVEGKPLDSRTDIYSFGVTCYYMLTGRPPFEGATAFEVALAHVRSDPAPLSEVRPDLPEGLCAVVAKMMAKGAEQRYQTGKDLLRDIARLREGLGGVTAFVPHITITADSGTLPQPAMSPAKRPRSVWLAVAFVGSLVLAALAGSALAWREGRDEAPVTGEALTALDERAAETATQSAKREQALRTLVDQALNPAPGKSPDAGAVNNCLELGLFYLDNDRLSDADELFGKLLELQAPESLTMLGKAGKGIVLALQNKPKESNDLFVEVFALDPRLVGPGKDKKGKGPAGPPSLRQLENRFEQRLAPIKPLLNHPRGKHWLARARWYNARNGLPTAQVPRYLLWLLPLEGELKK